MSSYGSCLPATVGPRCQELGVLGELLLCLTVGLEIPARDGLDLELPVRRHSPSLPGVDGAPIVYAKRAGGLGRATEMAHHLVIRHARHCPQRRTYVNWGGPLTQRRLLVSTYADHMSTFKDRLQQAAQHAGVEFSQAAIARSLGIERRQTVDRWFEDSVPRQEMVFHIATSWKVDPVWLGTGKGSMLPGIPTGLSQQEQDLLSGYRKLDKTRRLSVHEIVKVLAKAVVIIVLSITALTPQPSHASILHNASSQSSLWLHNTHWGRILCRWISAMRNAIRRINPGVRISGLSWT